MLTTVFRLATSTRRGRALRARATAAFAALDKEIKRLIGRDAGSTGG
jgi:aminoglycoside phosphotransferase